VVVGTWLFKENDLSMYLMSLRRTFERGVRDGSPSIEEKVSILSLTRGIKSLFFLCWTYGDTFSEGCPGVFAEFIRGDPPFSFFLAETSLEFRGYTINSSFFFGTRRPIFGSASKALSFTKLFCFSL
jgi:hypothetical protein